MDLFSGTAEKLVLPGGSRLFLGTSGYSFPGWRGVFYPERIRPKDWLRYYAEKFNSVEINSTYYGILTPKATSAMAEAVPDGFSFSVKLHSSMTHSRNAGRGEWKAFHAMLKPFADQGKAGMILAQFPWSFPLEEESFMWLEHLAENLSGHRTAMEFRHRKWYAKEPMERVGGMGFLPVTPDLPDLPGLPRTGILQSGGTFYIRLHGRNSGKWWGNTQERYDYLYDETEIQRLAAKLRGLSESAGTCYVFFNNCHMGKAALNAQDMQRLLSGSMEANE